MELSNISTTDIVDELKKRNGIAFYHYSVNQDVELVGWDNKEGGADSSVLFQGPASVVVVKRWE